MTSSRVIGIFTHGTENLSKVSKTFLIKPDSVLDTLGHCLRVIWAEKKADQDYDHHVFLICLLQAISRASLSTTVTGQGPPGNSGVTRLDEMFTGFQETTIICMECQNKLMKSRHFLELEIHLSELTTIINALKKRFTTELVTRYCTACRKETQNKKTESLGEAPQILRLDLKGATSCAEQSLVHDSFVNGLDSTPFDGHSRSSTTELRKTKRLTEMRNKVSDGTPFTRDDVTVLCREIVCHHIETQNESRIFWASQEIIDDKDMKKIHDIVTTQNSKVQARILLSAYPEVFRVTENTVAAARFFFLLNETLGFNPDSIPVEALVFGPCNERENVVDLLPPVMDETCPGCTSSVENRSSRAFYNFALGTDQAAPNNPGSLPILNYATRVSSSVVGYLVPKSQTEKSIQRMPFLPLVEYKEGKYDAKRAYKNELYSLWVECLVC
ncbi:hypothetical protein QAD02_010420 [Eretmocerus hayati]|uniref:Uncharacterized protein n=1 Tax=Eretmocerus hayati TaxID=131215 RepID=A0ACC2NTR1_9HYME|nr:hypothetical protein QAD02_010420 [Eretmocerus hayati]